MARRCREFIKEFNLNAHFTFCADNAAYEQRAVDSVTWLPTLMLSIHTYICMRMCVRMYICKNLLLLIFMKVEKFFGYLFNVGPREAQPDAAAEAEADVEVEAVAVAVAEVGKVSSGASVCA